MKQEYITSSQAAKILGITSRTLGNWDKQGILKPHHVALNGYRYYTEEQIYGFLEGYYNKPEKAQAVEIEILENTNGEIIELPLQEMDTTENIEGQPRQSKAIVAKNHYFSTSKLVRKLKEIALNEKVKVNLGKAGYVMVKMWRDKEMQEKMMNGFQVKIMPTAFNTPEYEIRLTEEDVFIMESVFSLKKAGNKEFTAAQLVKHMHGNGTGGISDEEIKAIEDRVRLMMTWFIRIEVTEEFKHYKNLPKEAREIKAIQGHLLDTVILERQDERGETRISFGFPINGCFGIPEEQDVSAILETYAKATKQMTCFPTSLLSMPGIRKSRTMRILMNYIVKKIQGLKGNKKGIDKILFTTIEKDLYMEDYPAKKKSIMRKFMVTIVENCKEQGLISDYEVIREGNKYESIKIKWEGQVKKKKNVGTGTRGSNKVRTRTS